MSPAPTCAMYYDGEEVALTRSKSSEQLAAFETKERCSVCMSEASDRLRCNSCCVLVCSSCMTPGQDCIQCQEFFPVASTASTCDTPPSCYTPPGGSTPPGCSTPTRGRSDSTNVAMQDQFGQQVLLFPMCMMPYDQQLVEYMPAYAHGVWDTSIPAQGAVEGKLQKLPKRKVRKAKGKDGASENANETKRTVSDKEFFTHEAAVLDKQAEMLQVAARQARVSAAVAHATEKVDSTSTTMMICDLPCRINRTTLVEAIESAGFGGTYDFLHLPCRYGHENTNIGYGFVNFKDSTSAANFAIAFEGYKFGGFKSTKRCRVKIAAHQGFDGSIDRDVRKKPNKP